MKKSKIIKNTDKEITNMLDEYFKENNTCPCNVIETNCMCEDFLQQESGLCHCERFEKILDNNL